MRFIRYMSLFHMCKFETTRFVDANLIGDIDNRKSTIGFVFTLGGTTISWASNLQKIVVMSTTKTKYVATTKAANEMI